MSLHATTRFEVKHALPENLAAEALDWCRPFLAPDRGQAGAQRVTSMYLDSPEMTFYRWHRERRYHRFKLRVRGYGEHPGERVFAEVKQKHGRIGRKSRAALPGAVLGALVTGDDAGQMRAGHHPALEEFVARRRAYGARPTLLIMSLREALRDASAGGETAITVDRKIVYQISAGSGLAADPGLWRAVALPAPLGPASTIVELKYAGDPQMWMATLLRHVAPGRVSFSKYVAAVRQHAAWSQW